MDSFTPRITRGLHDRYCDECGQLLVKVFPDGSHEPMGNVALAIKGEMNEQTGEVRNSTLLVHCLDCHPETGARDLPPEVVAALRQMLGDEAPVKEIEPGIKTPWGGGGL